MMSGWLGLSWFPEWSEPDNRYIENSVCMGFFGSAGRQGMLLFGSAKAAQKPTGWAKKA